MKCNQKSPSTFFAAYSLKASIRARQARFWRENTRKKGSLDIALMPCGSYLIAWQIMVLICFWGSASADEK